MKELVEGRKVALVGPAKYMLGSESGSEIDEHDLVVRINRGPELIEEYGQDIGTRTDILYSCLIEKPENAGFYNLELFRNKYQIKQLVAPPQSDMKGISSSTKLHSMINESKVANISEHIPFRVVDHTFHNALSRKIDCRPNTGFLAMYDLLAHNPEHLTIYGFSFYLDGFIPSYKKGVESDILMTEEEFANKCFNSKRHVQENMWQYCKDNFAQKANVSLDPVLQKILDLDEFVKGALEDLQ